MQIKSNHIIKDLRTLRKLPMAIFASMLGISTSYLSLLESGKREIQPQIIEKILAVLLDLTTEEKESLLKIKQSLETPEQDLEKQHKKIMGLISEYFYRLQNKIIEKIEELKKQIIDLIDELNKKYGQGFEIVDLFQKV